MSAGRDPARTLEPIDEPFDVTEPVPPGVTVLEASAGTGKTYTITALAAKYVAEGTPLERLLLVTFTRMATGELRERVRERLVSVERQLARFLAGEGASGEDEIVGLLALGSTADVEVRRARLARALADFDGATIETTHGFCRTVLSGLGIAGDIEPDVEFAETLDDLVDEVIDDLYVRRFSPTEAGPAPFGRAQAGLIARTAIEKFDAPISPAAGEPAETRVRLAQAARLELERRKRRAAVMTYDDLLTRLDEALGSDNGDLIAQRLRDQYDVVLVDEFQDTDPVQWRIMQRAFGTGDRTLVLIADPKQAIYAFRGADVYAYLDAASSAVAHPTLGTNRRSDQPLLDAYDALFENARLGHEGIAYRRVDAPRAHREPRLKGAANGAPLRIRILDREQSSVATTQRGLATADSARAHVARDVAADIVALLSSGATIDTRSEDGTTLLTDPICPGHVAVLVRTNRTAALIRDELEAASVPAVINGAGSVFGTRSAQDWLQLLQALERPASPSRCRAAALTCFIGWSAERVADASEPEWAELHGRLHEWARELRARGVAALLETVTLVERLPERVLRDAHGERRLTDVRHVAQLLHQAASEEQLAVTALTAWLRRRIAEAESDAADEDRSRRLESDAEAVQVLTIHRSKGLEFPIVYAPFLWDPTWFSDERAPVVFHDAANDDRRTIDVALEGADYDAHRSQSRVEERGGELRLAYVALTRARHQAVTWWAGSTGSRNSPLSRLAFAKASDGTVPIDAGPVPSDREAWARFSALAASAPGRISIEWARSEPGASWSPEAQPTGELVAATFDRMLDWRWRRTSYSDITAGAYEPLVGSEAEEALVVDEPDADTPVARPDPDDDPTPLALAAMGSGTRVGTLVHRAFEATDFAAADLEAELAARIEELSTGRTVELGDRAIVVSGLADAIRTPLGSLLGGASLSDIRREDRLDELGFELPLVGGDQPTGQLTLAMIASVLRSHVRPGEPLHGYAERLGDAGLRSTVRGYLTGSLDLVARIAGTDGRPRFAVLDYKTNRLAGPDEPLTAGHYAPAALEAEMRHGHYGLQALLYAVALHRFLRWRLVGYDPDRDLAGVVYLFLRGMRGADVPGSGVWSWRPSGALVQELSDVLDLGSGVAR